MNTHNSACEISNFSGGADDQIAYLGQCLDFDALLQQFALKMVHFVFQSLHIGDLEVGDRGKEEAL